jgi:ADP-ribose pyrophosphatase
MRISGLEVLGDERVGQGGHLIIRRIKLRLVGEGGEKTAAGTWDFVERPMGLDAVVLVIWSRSASGVEVLLRKALRVPLRLGRTPPGPLLFTELVAGILEANDELSQRAQAEAREEAGIEVARVEPLGPPMYPTPGMCAEQFHFAAAEVTDEQRAAMRPPQGDGSPFEEGAQLEWVLLDEALASCADGRIQDLKTEVGLRRLREKVK